jgi:hypothetical protein
MAGPHGDGSDIEIKTTADPLVAIQRVVINTAQDVLLITTSNAEVILARAWRRVRGKSDWVAPLGVFVTILLALLTTSFTKKANISADAWKAIFAVGAGLNAIWLIYVLIQLKRRGRGISPGQVVQLLMDGGTVTQATSWGLQPPSAVTTHPAITPPAPPSGTGDVSIASVDPKHVTQSDRSRRRGSPQRHKSSKDPVAGSEPSVSGGNEIARQGGPSDTTMQGGSYAVGTRVRHENFGEGSVLSGEPDGGHTFLQVRFDDADVGTKRLREDLAPLQQL